VDQLEDEAEVVVSVVEASPRGVEGVLEAEEEGVGVDQQGVGHRPMLLTNMIQQMSMIWKLTLNRRKRMRYIYLLN
jgi:hypothetical protein